MHEWIVIVTERNVWPAKHGCDARIVQLIRGYQKCGFRVCLVGTQHSTIGLAEHLVDDLLITGGPSWDWYQDIDKFDAGWFFGGILEAMKRHDVAAVQVEYCWMSKALEVVTEGIIKIIDTHDLMYNRAGIYDPYGILPYCRITREREAELLNRADVILAIQDIEAEEFKSMCPDKEVVTVGHWAEGIKACDCDENSNIVMLVGSDNPSNVMGGQVIVSQWDKVREKVPNAELRIYGTLSDKVNEKDGIVTYGFVQNLERAYSTAKLVINPTVLGTGLKIKTVEAMAHGKAVVTTKCGADGISGGVMVSDDLIRDIVYLLTESSSRKEFERRALSYAMNNFSINSVLGRVVETIKRGKK